MAKELTRASQLRTYNKQKLGAENFNESIQKIPPGTEIKVRKGRTSYYAIILPLEECNGEGRGVVSTPQAVIYNYGTPQDQGKKVGGVVTLHGYQIDEISIVEYKVKAKPAKNLSEEEQQVLLELNQWIKPEGNQGVGVLEGEVGVLVEETLGS